MQKRISYYLSRRRKRQCAAFLLLVILASFAEMTSIGALVPFLTVLSSPDKVYAYHWMQPFIAFFDIREAGGLLLPLTLLFAGIALLSGMIRLALLWFQMRLSHAIGADLSMDIYRRTLYQPYRVHVARNSSETIAGISSKVDAVVYNVILPFLSILGALPILVGILIALFLIDPLVTLIAFSGFGLIYYLLVLVFRKRLQIESQHVNQESVQTVKAMQEGLGGIRDILIDGTQATYCSIYKCADHRLRHSRANIQIISGTPRFVIEAIGMALIAALAYILSVEEKGMASAIPVLGALALGAQRILPVLQQTYHSWTSIKGAEHVLQSVLDLLRQPLPAYADSSLPAPIVFDRHIRLDCLSFRYTEDGPLVIKEVDLCLPKGKRIGFIGETGSGKSTLLDIVMGLLEPVSGGLRIDETLVDAFNVRAWQTHIAHVPQAIFLADASVAENIAFGAQKKEINLERVRLAAEKAQIAHTIETWPAQYHTEVGERGIRLSGGQRQRIGIARALYKDADVIILDEATSALDNETEMAVMDAIDMLDTDLTILIIAHRLSTLKNCDLIVELKQGGVKRVGRYSEIITHGEG